MREYVSYRKKKPDISVSQASLFLGDYDDPTSSVSFSTWGFGVIPSHILTLTTTCEVAV